MYMTEYFSDVDTSIVYPIGTIVIGCIDFWFYPFKFFNSCRYFRYKVEKHLGLKSPSSYKLSFDHSLHDPSLLHPKLLRLCDHLPCDVLYSNWVSICYSNHLRLELFP